MIFNVGISPCPNDIFIFSGILTGNVHAPNWHFVFEDVETLNQKAMSGILDLSKISFACYPLIEKEYNLLSSGGALGYGCGPLLLCSEKLSYTDLHDISGWKKHGIMVPGKHTTAKFLLDFFLEKEKVPLKFLSFDQIYHNLINHSERWGVVIHENRFTYERDGLVLVRDLGEYWESKTGLPIPLGTMVLHKKHDEVSRIEKMIRDSLEWAWNNEAEALQLCRQHAQEMEEKVMKNHIQLYVNDFSLDQGAIGKKAVEFFLKAARFN